MQKTYPKDLVYKKFYNINSWSFHTFDDVGGGGGIWIYPPPPLTFICENNIKVIRLCMQCVDFFSGSFEDICIFYNR